MKFRTPKLRTMFKVAVTGAALTIVAGNVAGAIGNESTPKRFTGCLKSTGTLSKIKAGDAPLSSCASGETAVTVGNGDITGVAAGAGMTGGATQGVATLGLGTNYQLPQGCAAGQPVKRGANGWVCGSDYGTTTKSVGGVSVDNETPPQDGSNCVGDYSMQWISYTPPGNASSSNSATFTLPTGTYLPSVLSTSRWYINRTYDLLDGEQFSKGYVRMKVQRTRAGVTTTVATWARSESENLDGAGVPYTQDPGVFTALAGDTFQIVADANTVYCTRARLLDGGMDFTRIG
jgi:hypothetical protein